MSDLLSKNAFGSKENIEAAKTDGVIDVFDIIYLDNGEIGWINKENDTVINTPRTQEEITVDTAIQTSELTTIAAGQSMDDLAKLVVQKVAPSILESAKKYTDDQIPVSSSVTVVEF